jgi:hypothetical protein
MLECVFLTCIIIHSVIKTKKSYLSTLLLKNMLK